MEAEYRTIANMTVRVRLPSSSGPHPLYVLLHGLTGDENSMGVFASRLPKHAFLLAPRGIYTVKPRGYSWHSVEKSIRAKLIDFNEAIESLRVLLEPANFPQVDISRFYMVGFSQGAALTLSYLLTHPGRVIAAAGLSGFLPEGALAIAEHRPLDGKRVFLAHGTLDKQVPIEMGRQAVGILEQAGARVTFCEDEIGHKLSASCFRGLEAFFREGTLNC